MNALERHAWRSFADAQRRAARSETARRVVFLAVAAMLGVSTGGSSVWSQSPRSEFPSAAPLRSPTYPTSPVSPGSSAQNLPGRPSAGAPPKSSWHDPRYTFFPADPTSTPGNRPTAGAARPANSRPQTPVTVAQAEDRPGRLPEVLGPNTAPQNAPPLNVAPTAPVRELRGRLDVPELVAPEACLKLPPETPEMTQRYRQFVPRVIDPEKTIDVCVGIPRILVFSETPARIYVPDESVVKYQIIDGTHISIVGVKPGNTVLSVWMPAAPSEPETQDSKRILSYMVQVAPEPMQQQQQRIRQHQIATYRDLERQINDAFPNSRIELNLIGEQLLVRGQAKDAIEAAHILNVLSRHSPRRRGGEGGNESARETQALYLVDGDPQQAAEQAGYRRSVLDAEALGNAGIVNLLEIPGEQQVMLRVTVAEVNRSAARSIGLNFSVNNNQGTQIFSSTVGAVGGVSNLLANLDNGQVLLAVNALRTLRLAKTLAEPNLVALNGQQAQFQAGGRFPVPVIGGFTNNGLQGVTFVPFGIQLNFTPTIVDRDRIRLAVNAEVSTRDVSTGANIGGAAVSGITSRNFNTTVELREGQTLAVAGLIQQNHGADSDRVPFWGDLPLIGHTGGYNRTSSGEQELVILITPELVHPLEACETPHLPGADIFEPTDIEFYLGNRLESRRTRDFRSSVRTDYHRIRAGDKYCEDQFIIGPNGPTYGCCNLNQNCPTPAPPQGVVPVSHFEPPRY